MTDTQLGEESTQDPLQDTQLQQTMQSIYDKQWEQRRVLEDQPDDSTQPPRPPPQAAPIDANAVRSTEQVRREDDLTIYALCGH
jgi:hypothetical protein